MDLIVSILAVKGVYRYHGYPTAEQSLAIVMDLHSRKIIGWAMDKRMTTALIERAMQMAITLRNSGKGLIFHSDRGSQYTSKRYGKLLKKHGIRASMR